MRERLDRQKRVDRVERLKWLGLLELLQRLEKLDREKTVERPWTPRSAPRTCAQTLCTGTKAYPNLVCRARVRVGWSSSTAFMCWSAKTRTDPYSTM